METPFKPTDWDSKITRLGGTNYRGEPNLRTVWSPDMRKWNETYKYPTPDDARVPMECWVLEVWLGPSMFGSPMEWKSDIMGPFPYDGLYAMKTPLMTGDGKFLPLNDATFEAIERKQLLDLQWSQTNAKDRLEEIERLQAERQAAQDELAHREVQETYDHYYSHAEQMANSDNRVFSMPAKLDITAKGNKETR